MYGEFVIFLHRYYTPSLTNYGNWETEERGEDGRTIS